MSEIFKDPQPKWLERLAVLAGIITLLAISGMAMLGAAFLLVISEAHADDRLTRIQTAWNAGVDGHAAGEPGGADRGSPKATAQAEAAGRRGITPELSRPAAGHINPAEAEKRARLERIVRWAR